MIRVVRQVAQIGGRFFIPGDTRDQAGWSCEQGVLAVGHSLQKSRTG